MLVRVTPTEYPDADQQWVTDIQMIRDANHFIYIGTLSMIWDRLYVSLNTPVENQFL